MRARLAALLRRTANRLAPTPNVVIRGERGPELVTISTGVKIDGAQVERALREHWRRSGRRGIGL